MKSYNALKIECVALNNEVLKQQNASPRCPSALLSTRSCVAAQARARTWRGTASSTIWQAQYEMTSNPGIRLKWLSLDTIEAPFVIVIAAISSSKSFIDSPRDLSFAERAANHS